MKVLVAADSETGESVIEALNTRKWMEFDEIRITSIIDKSSKAVTDAEIVVILTWQCERLAKCMPRQRNSWHKGFKRIHPIAECLAVYLKVIRPMPSFWRRSIGKRI